jgi:hypothetical protein
VTNTGNADLVYGASAVALSGTNAADFAITTDNCSSLSVLSSANCTVVLSFTPSAIGTRTANLVFTDNASGSPHSVALTGVGLGAAISTTVTPIPATQVGNTSALQTLTVTNSGNANLIFGALAAVLGGANAADYTIVTDGCSNQTIAPAATCTITFTYNPKQAGTSAASIDLTSNAIGSPTSVTLSGVATSGISQPLDVTAPPKTPAANDVTVTPGNGLLTVGINFHDFITYEPGSYVVTASPSGNSCVISSPSGTCTIMGLTPGVDYTISIVATNVFGSSGAYTSARTWQPLGASALRVAARLKLIDFKGDSPVLLAKLRAKVKKFVKAHPSLTNFTCVGFTAGQHVLKTDHALARARATNVCGFLATLKPASIETIIGRTPGLPFGGQYRRVVVTGWGTIK